MNTTPSPYSGYRYPTEIISHATWLCFYNDDAAFGQDFIDIDVAQ